MLCPRCDYDLTGLPAVHACPECGCRYDEHSIGIPLTARRYELLGVCMVGFFFTFLTWLKLRRGAARWEFLVDLLMPVVFLAGVGWRFQKRAGLPTRLTLDRDGVALMTPGQEPVRWAWGEIGSAELGDVWSFFMIYSLDRVTLFSRYSSRLGSRKLVKRCAAEINKRIAIYASHPTDAPAIFGDIAPSS